MARKTFADRRTAALEELKAAQQRIAKLEDEAARHIGKLAIKAGLGDLDLDDEKLFAELEAVAAKFRQKSADNPKGGAATAAGNAAKSGAAEPSQS
ncbi:TraC family protein [Paraburkholderia strydomiana]|uniref:TraC family protein n=1 Tax=Paraburkholderia strydomiana TaxID=1245417 RepID=UPI0038BCA825